MYYQKKNVDVLIFVEHKDREIEITCELAKYLTSIGGIKIAIASALFDLVTAAFFLRPKVIVTPSSSFAKGSPGAFFFRLYGNHIFYINLNYEQFLGSWLGNFKSATHPVSKNFQKHFTWGEYFKNFLIRSGVNKNNIFITGRPSFSLLSKNYEGGKAYYRKLISDKLNIDPNKKWIFIGLTDGLAFNNDKLVSCIINYGGNERKLINHINWLQKTIEILIHWIGQIDQEPDLDIGSIILRPHPSVSIHDYERLIFKQLGHIPKNLLISKEFNALMWMTASDKYYTNFSTLCLESNMLKVPYYIIRPVEEENDDIYWWCEGVPILRSYDQFYSSVLINEWTAGNIDILKNGLHHYIEVERNALVETAQNILSIAGEVDSYPILKWKSLLKAISTNPKRIIGICIRLIFMKLHINPFKIVREGILSDFFNNKEIKRYLVQGGRL